MDEMLRVGTVEQVDNDHVKLFHLSSLVYRTHPNHWHLPVVFLCPGPVKLYGGNKRKYKNTKGS